MAGSLRETEAICSIIFKLYTMHEEIRRGKNVSSVQLVGLMHLNRDPALGISTHYAILHPEHPRPASCRYPAAAVLLA
jgi:hypothetical protein